MPFGIHKHSNRSKQVLNNPDPSSSSIDEGGQLPPPPFDNIQPNTLAGGIPRRESYAEPRIVPDHDPQAQSTADYPIRSQSTRFPPSSPYQQQLQNAGSADDLGINRYQQQGGPYTPEPAKKSKGGFFERMRGGSSREPKASSPGVPSQADYNNTAGLARRLSKKENIAPINRTITSRNSVERLDWQSAQDPRTTLPSQQEEQNNDFDPFLQVEDSQRGAQSQLPTIRTVHSEADGKKYSAPQNYHSYATQEQSQSAREPQHQSQSDSQLYFQNENQGHILPHLNISRPSLVASDTYQNPETVSQLSFESQVNHQEERPVSGQSNGQSPTAHSAPIQAVPNRSSSIPLQPNSQHLQSQYEMPPPSGNNAGRRAADNKPIGATSQGPPDSRDGGQPNYSRGQFANNQATALGAQSPYRGGPTQRDQFNPQTERAGTPPLPAPLPPGTSDISDSYKELLTKYKKVKGLYFEKTAQVEQLQNTLANQRLSQSRTSLDDSEYMTRFQRLDGAIVNLAFNIRKDWRSIPAWLSHWVNQEALKIGKQEMTAVGRAVITRFVVDEIFHKTFHPGLDIELSSKLKLIEHNIRHFSPALNNQEESDALNAKVVQWRLATLEGLKEVLSSSEADEHKKDFTRLAVTNLTAHLMTFLQDPAPAGIEDSAHMIIELAVNIALNLPLESRCVSIVHPMPGDLVQPAIMKIESNIAILENPGAETEDTESRNSLERDSEKEDKDGNKLRKAEKKSQGMLQAMMGGGSQKKTEEKKMSNTEDGAQKVRFAGFVGVEVRGRQVLAKAPVWTVS